MTDNASVEPWLRGTHTNLDAVRCGVLHALELALEDIDRWCGALDVQELDLEPFRLPSVGFQLRHIARSLDRLMTYAEGEALSDAQLLALREERQTTGNAVAEAHDGIQRAIQRLLRFSPEDFPQHRGVGRAKLPTTVGGLLIHIAEHTQRHTGQLITTAKIVQGLRDLEVS